MTMTACGLDADEAFLLPSGLGNNLTVSVSEEIVSDLPAPRQQHHVQRLLLPDSLLRNHSLLSQFKLHHLGLGSHVRSQQS